ncbi:hypothetical protein [Mycobacterium palustre]|uniref:Head-to-tail adaptor n=1 Tax=Mycobacterium palustre TaxID=153971 RepID=A0A1X1ZBY5_9MYCO|nr:hypothetical protein [Mycobacterium palustre]MCV7100079.1 hypothetical protein [Mycobacterium palustre]ORW20913.1 hypothetical protein AWC19_14190 [Mycobacterium palustre]
MSQPTFDPGQPTEELTPADVEQYTGGRLLADDDETARLLRGALAAVRRYCGWRVTPVGVDTVTLDGPGRRLLSLPTLQLVELQSVTEDGVELDVSTLEWSKAGLVRKKSGARWSHHYGSIEVRMEHGYADAWDWQSAVLELIDREAAAVGAVAGNSGPMIEKKVDDVVYRWMNTIGDPANQAAFDMLNHEIIDPYRIEQVR